MFDRVKILQVAGNGIRAIVRETGFNWRTVAKWAGLGELPERNVMAAKPTAAGNFQNHLSRRTAARSSDVISVTIGGSVAASWSRDIRIASRLRPIPSSSC